MFPLPQLLGLKPLTPYRRKFGVRLVNESSESTALAICALLNSFTELTTITLKISITRHLQKSAPEINRILKY